jgi:hypothetical protein
MGNWMNDTFSPPRRKAPVCVQRTGRRKDYAKEIFACPLRLGVSLLRSRAGFALKNFLGSTFWSASVSPEPAKDHARAEAKTSALQNLFYSVLHKYEEQQWRKYESV